MLFRSLFDGHGAGHIHQIQAADHPLFAADGDGDRSDFLFLIPTAKVLAKTVFSRAGQNGIELQRFARKLKLFSRSEASISISSCRSFSGQNASQVRPDAVFSSGKRRPTIAR